METIRIDTTRSLRLNLVVCYLIMGLLFRLLFHGFPWPFSIATWLHVLVWPVYVMLGLLRWIFYPFAVLAIIGFAAAFLLSRRRG
jgi:hypothetical protein